VSMAQKMVGLWRRAAGLLLNGDYYALTPFSKSPEEWVVRQFAAPETAEGLIHGIRLAACAAETITNYPRALRPDRRYVLDNPETGETREIAGQVLVNDGFTIALPRRSGAIWFYKEKEA